MHGSFDKSGETGNPVFRRIGLFALPLLIIITLAGLAMSRPAASKWLSDAAQAEVAGDNSAPEPAPMQRAKPAGDLSMVKAN
jgi:hypothetical protein